MRILPQNFVLYGRRSLRILGLCGVAGICGSCAKFPPNANANFTAITFTFTVAGIINVTAPYIYDVAICSSISNDPPLTWAPLPVINSSNPNGRMAGSPTEFIEFNSANPLSANPYTLYQFALSSQIPNPNDPTNLVNLSYFSPSQLGLISQYSNPVTSGTPNQISFTVYTNELPSIEGKSGQVLQTLYVNILTMTQLASQPSGRIIDSVGNLQTVNGINDFLTINLLKTGTYSGTLTGGTFGGTDPDVQLTSYTITVAPP